ncbi:MAG: FAD/NAD(P)-binding protein, partial [Planctomycetes bacterium]|nr:FAD/NAD(P)-binding protein [Planctomycetota bacterium]
MSVPGSPFTVAVVGGGFSGVTVVANLVRRRAVGGGRAARTMRVAVFEASGTLARGAAYGTTDDRHLLNVPAARMGAWADAPGD